MVSYAHTYHSNFFARLVRWKMQWNAGIPYIKNKMRKASTFSLSIAFLLRSSRNSQHNLDDIQAIDWSKDFSGNLQGGLLKENKIVKKRNKRAKLSFKLWKFHNRPESRTRTSCLNGLPTRHGCIRLSPCSCPYNPRFHEPGEYLYSFFRGSKAASAWLEERHHSPNSLLPLSTAKISRCKPSQINSLKLQLIRNFLRTPWKSIIHGVIINISSRIEVEYWYELLKNNTRT